MRACSTPRLWLERLRRGRAVARLARAAQLRGVLASSPLRNVRLACNLPLDVLMQQGGFRLHQLMCDTGRLRCARSVCVCCVLRVAKWSWRGQMVLRVTQMHRPLPSCPYTQVRAVRFVTHAPGPEWKGCLNHSHN